MGVGNGARVGLGVVVGASVGTGVAVGMGVAAGTSCLAVGNEIAVGTDVGTGVGDGVGTGAGIAVGTGVAVGGGTGVAVGSSTGIDLSMGNRVGEVITGETGGRFGAGVLVGMTTATGSEALTDAEMAVGVGAIVGRGRPVVTGEGVSPIALPLVTNTAATVTAVARKRMSTTGATGTERREVNKWCFLTSRSSRFSRRKSTEPIFSNKEMITANSIYTPPTGTSQTGSKAQTDRPHQ